MTEKYVDVGSEMEDMIYYVFKKMLKDVDGGEQPEDVVKKHVNDEMIGEGVEEFWKGIEESAQESPYSLRTTFLINIGLVLEAIETKRVEEGRDGTFQIRINITDKGKVRIDHGQVYSWMDMYPSEAMKYAQKIIDVARMCLSRN